jgi:hypothetical protein
MLEQFSSEPEKCECKKNEKEERQIIEIKQLDSNTLEVFQPAKPISNSQTVTRGHHCSITNRSFDSLSKLGVGTHSICKCRKVGAPDSIKAIRAIDN